MKKEILKTKNYYNGIAPGYFELYYNEQIKKINLVREFLPNNSLILDLGCGGGVLNDFCSNLISFDLSFELLKLNSNHKKVCGSILNLPFRDNSFYFICSFTVFQDLPNVYLGISEIKRVLSSGGTIILSFLKMSSKAEKIVKLLEENFNILKQIEEEKDLIFVCEKN